MKKIMILVTIAMMAVVSQAYDIKWGARNIYIPVATDVKVAESGIVAASGSKFDATTALTVQLYWVGTSGNNYIGEFTTTGSGTISAQTLASGTSSALYLAMVDDQGNTWKPQYYYTATYTTADGTYTYSGTVAGDKPIGNLASTSLTLTAKFDETGSWTYTPKSTPVDPTDDVPEPTSGLLLLLGAAGLALRRKMKQ